MDNLSIDNQSTLSIAIITQRRRSMCLDYSTDAVECDRFDHSNEYSPHFTQPLLLEDSVTCSPYALRKPSAFYLFTESNCEIFANLIPDHPSRALFGPDVWAKCRHESRRSHRANLRQHLQPTRWASTFAMLPKTMKERR